MKLGRRTALPPAQGVPKMSIGREQDIGSIQTTSEIEPYSGMFTPAPPLLLAQRRHRHAADKPAILEPPRASSTTLESRLTFASSNQSSPTHSQACRRSGPPHGWCLAALRPSHSRSGSRHDGCRRTRRTSCSLQTFRRPIPRFMISCRRCDGINLLLPSTFC
jgi:hypothetical protein